MEYPMREQAASVYHDREVFSSNSHLQNSVQALLSIPAREPPEAYRLVAGKATTTRVKRLRVRLCVLHILTL